MFQVHSLVNSYTQCLVQDKCSIKKYRKIAWQFLKKLNIQLPLLYCKHTIHFLTPRYLSKQIENSYSNKNLCMHIYSHNTHNRRKAETTQMPVNGWMDKPTVGYPYNGYQSAIKRNDILIHATIGMNLRNIMVSETSQTQGAIYYIIPST